MLSVFILWLPFTAQIPTDLHTGTGNAANIRCCVLTSSSKMGFFTNISWKWLPEVGLWYRRGKEMTWFYAAHNDEAFPKNFGFLPVNDCNRVTPPDTRWIVRAAKSRRCSRYIFRLLSAHVRHYSQKKSANTWSEANWQTGAIVRWAIHRFKQWGLQTCEDIHVSWVVKHSLPAFDTVRDLHTIDFAALLLPHSMIRQTF